LTVSAFCDDPLLSWNKNRGFRARFRSHLEGTYAQQLAVGMGGYGYNGSEEDPVGGSMIGWIPMPISHPLDNCCGFVGQNFGIGFLGMFQGFFSSNPLTVENEFTIESRYYYNNGDPYVEFYQNNVLRWVIDDLGATAFCPRNDEPLPNRQKDVVSLMACGIDAECWVKLSHIEFWQEM
jgi:hypothetical protein